MSEIVYGVYDSTDAAEFAAARIKHTVKNAKIVGISKRVLPDESEETTIYAFPGLSGGNGATNMAFPFFNSYITDSVRDSNFEPAHREDVTLRVEAPNGDMAQLIMSLMRNHGGREIRTAKNNR